MTSDEFRAEYRVGQRLTSGGIQTTLAQEARKGRIVLVHELAPASEPEQRRALILLRELAPNDASQVIGTFEVDGETVVVTKFLMGFTSLLGWLEASVAESSTTVVVTSDNPSTMDMAIHNPDYRRPLTDLPVSPSLEDTSTQPVLASPVARTPTPPPAQPSPPLPAKPSPPPSVPTTEEEPTSSFTKLFGESEASVARLADSAATMPDRSVDGPGEFTLHFGASAVDATPSSQDPSIDVSRGLRAPEAMSLPPVSEPAPAGDTAPTAATPAKPTTADDAKTGDFTRLFGNEPGTPPPGPATPKPPPAVRATPMEQAKASQPPPPFVRLPAANAFDFEDTGPAPIAPVADASLPPPPRVRLEALEGAPVRSDSASRGQYDSAPRGPASVPPSPFSVPPLVAVPAGRVPTPIPQSNRSAAVNPATLPEGGYTEMLTPARPPLNAAPPRTPTPAVGQAAQPPRTSYTPLIVGLIVFVVLMAAFVAYFVMSSP